MKDYVIMSLPAELLQFLSFTDKIQFSFPTNKVCQRESTEPL